MAPDYKQPSFYHFSADSLFLAKTAADYCLTNRIEKWKVLDLGAGCGVVGIEFVLALQEKRQVERDIELTFLETQEGFLPCLQQNIQTFLPNIKTSICKQNFLELNENCYFDIILCNPPYFLEGSGLASSSPERNRCLFLGEDEQNALYNIFRNNAQYSFFLSRKVLDIFSPQLLETLAQTKLYLFK